MIDEGNKSEKAAINSRLLAVRGVLSREYLPLAGRLPENVRPELDFAGQDAIPLLVLLPMCAAEDKAALDLAAAMEFAYLAGRVHDLNCDANLPQGGKLNGHAILVGDYLYAFAAVRLNGCGLDGWLDKIGNALVRRSEARQQRLGWDKRPYVADEEKLANLAREHAEVVALAGRLAAGAAKLPDEQQAAYAEFGFYLGLLHGISVCKFAPSEAVCQAESRALAGARAALGRLPELSAAAEELLLRPLSCRAEDVSHNKFLHYNKEEISKESSKENYNEIG